MNDERIIELYLSRDESAISQTMKKYGSMLNVVSERITGDRSEAEECVNDTLLEAWNRIPPHEPRGYFPAFLSRIVRNISINRCVEKERLKRKAFITELSDELEQCIPSKSSPESSVEGIELGRVISEFLRKQPEEKRRIFVRRYYYLDPVSRIAENFGCSAGKVKTELFRMRSALKNYLEKEGYSL